MFKLFSGTVESMTLHLLFSVFSVKSGFVMVEEILQEGRQCFYLLILKIKNSRSQFPPDNLGGRKTVP